MNILRSRFGFILIFTWLMNHTASAQNSDCAAQIQELSGIIRSNCCESQWQSHTPGSPARYAPMPYRLDGSCGFAQGLTEYYSGHAGFKGWTVATHNASSIFAPDGNAYARQHSFALMTSPSGRTFLVDPTFSQFEGTVAKNVPTRMRDQLVKHGFMEMSPEDFIEYGNAFTVDPLSDKPVVCAKTPTLANAAKASTEKIDYTLNELDEILRKTYPDVAGKGPDKMYASMCRGGCQAKNVAGLSSAAKLNLAMAVTAVIADVAEGNNAPIVKEVQPAVEAVNRKLNENPLVKGVQGHINRQRSYHYQGQPAPAPGMRASQPKRWFKGMHFIDSTAYLIGAFRDGFHQQFGVYPMTVNWFGLGDPETSYWRQKKYEGD